VPVVLDEAYHEYVTDPGVGSSLALRARFPNLIVTRTFSKAYGLAGLRIGYAVADRGVIDIVNRLRESFNVNGLALLAAERALEDPEHVSQVRVRTEAMRNAMAAVISALGLQVAPSQTNFILVDFGQAAAPIEARLLERGVVTRPMGGYGLPTCLRVNVGREDENARFLHALKRSLA
jgi:histidinol-phosphate aminotransferase